MKRLNSRLMYVCASLALFSIAAGTADRTAAHEVQYATSMSGPGEFPSNTSPGIGSALVTIDLDTLQMRVQASFAGLTGNVTAAHIHCCVSPSASPPTVGVATPTPTFPGFPAGVTSGTYDQTLNLGLASSYNGAFVNANGGTPSGALQAFLNGLDRGEAYFNIHTSTFGGGEIRGFLTPVPEPSSALGLFVAGLAFVARRRRASC